MSEQCEYCEGSLEARLREQAATFAAQDDASTEYVRELLEEAAQATTPNTCSTCKWWKKVQTRAPGIFRPCDGDGYEIRFCFSPKNPTGIAPMDGMVLEEGSGACGPDFGCVNHET